MDAGEVRRKAEVDRVKARGASSTSSSSEPVPSETEGSVPAFSEVRRSYEVGKDGGGG